MTCQPIRGNYLSIACVLAPLEKNKLFKTQQLITVTLFSLNEELQPPTVFESKLTTHFKPTGWPATRPINLIAFS